MKRILSTVREIPIEVVEEFDQIEIEVKGEISRSELLEIVHRYDGIIAADIIDYDEEVFEKAEKLQVITRFGVGVDNVDIEAASKHEIKVTNVPGENSESVAEQAIGLMIAASKNFAIADRKMRSGDWSREHGYGYELAGKTLGQIGFGNIGRLIAQKCRAAFHMDVLVHDPYVPEYEMRNLVSGRKVGLDEALEKGDVISVNIPATDETRNMFDIKKFEKMKETAIFVNTARGEVVVEDDLAKALENGEIFAAGLDVMREEPTSEENPLFEKDHTVFTPHAGARTPEADERILRLALRDQMAVFEGRRPVGLQEP